jgi:hypothetical protein
MLLEFDGAVRVPARPVVSSKDRTQFERNVELARGQGGARGGAVVPASLPSERTPPDVPPAQLDAKQREEAARALELVTELARPIYRNLPDEDSEPMRREARELLTKGYVAAGLPHVYDQAGLTAALDAYEAALVELGGDSTGFKSLAGSARQRVESDLEALFAPLRAPVAEAQRTGNWQPVSEAMADELGRWTEGSADPGLAVASMAGLLEAGGPRQGEGADAAVDSRYLQAVEEAERLVLVDRPAQEIAEVAARNELTAPAEGSLRPEESTTVAPELRVAEELTRDSPERAISPELAADILATPEVRQAVSGVIEDYWEGPYERGTNTIDAISQLADRANRTPEGSVAVDQWANDLVDLAEREGMEIFAPPRPT